MESVSLDKLLSLSDSQCSLYSVGNHSCLVFFGGVELEYSPRKPRAHSKHLVLFSYLLPSLMRESRAGPWPSGGDGRH